MWHCARQPRHRSRVQATQPQDRQTLESEDRRDQSEAYAGHHPHVGRHHHHPGPRIQPRRRFLARPEVVDADLQGDLQVVVRPGVRRAQTHLDFLEKIAEGFVIEAYNSTKEKGYNSKPEQKQMKLDAYDLSMLERALEEMRGTCRRPIPKTTAASRSTSSSGVVTTRSTR
mmetsp:Transcript_71750/g.215668  ORF Transcript_71750/g.215668 Transcript_71750/m.215668 type:complete len:171 (+) Transcript_71750:221-733(+)